MILAFHAYCQIPFAKTKASNPDVIKVAQLLGRTPSAVARKLGNFGAFDPTLAAKGISGLKHVGKADQAIWNEFYGNWAGLIKESQRIRAALQPFFPEPEIAVPIPKGETERHHISKQRVYQDFFRQSVLASYDSACCVCQCDLLPLLVASHIVPWAIDKQNRLNPENGLCLCLLHDGAFDRGLISISEDLAILVSKKATLSKSVFVHRSIVQFGSRRINSPRRFQPRSEFLCWHKDNVFVP